MVLQAKKSAVIMMMVQMEKILLEKLDWTHPKKNTES